jgi:hypothetical protein
VSAPISSVEAKHLDGLVLPSRQEEASERSDRPESIQVARPELTRQRTVAVLRGDSNVKGTVTFEQADESSPTTISWNITGHDANAERGMHIHAFGDNTNGCTSAGPHCEFSGVPRILVFEHCMLRQLHNSQPPQQDSRCPERRGAPRR